MVRVSVATRASGRLRPLPTRNDDLAHLDLAELRVYRSTLQTEEGRVSYWRRLVQARLDLLRAGEARGGLSVDAAGRVLLDQRVGAGRQALLAIVPRDDIPPLPNLAELWRTELRPEDPVQWAWLERELADAERTLSAYRTALHRRMDAATAELIARYREQPTLCLSALPTEPPAPLRSGTVA